MAEKEIIPNHTSLQVDWEKQESVTLCQRPNCRQELRTKKFYLYTTREIVQKQHDLEVHKFVTEFDEGKCHYRINGVADSQEQHDQLAQEAFAGFQKGKKTAFPSTSFVKRAHTVSKSPRKSELYEPVDLKPGAMVAFTKRETPVYKERDVANGYYGYEIDYYEPEEHFKGQVWSEGPKNHPKSVWVVTEDQRAFVVHKDSFNVLEEWKP